MDDSDHSNLANDHSGVGPPSASSAEGRAWTLLSDTDAGGDLDVEEVLSEALAALRPPREPATAIAADTGHPWRETLPHIRARLDEARSDENDRAVCVRAARATHILGRLESAAGATQSDGHAGPGRSPVAVAWPNDLLARRPLPPLLDDAWWFLCAAHVAADAPTETRLRNAIAVLLDGSPYELGPEPPQTIPWLEAIQCAVTALTAHADASPDPVEILRAGRTTAALVALSESRPA